MYTVAMNGLILTIKQGTWETEVDLCEATSLGQRLSNGKLLSKALTHLYKRMEEQGMTRAEQDKVEDNIFEVIHAHSLELV